MKPKNFVRTPKYLVRDFRIPVPVRLFLVILRSYAFHKDDCWPSYPTLATDMGCTVRQVFRYADYAEEIGLLRRVPKDPQNPKGKTRFILLDHAAEERFQKLADPKRKIVTPMSPTLLTPMSHEEEEVLRDRPIPRREKPQAG